MAKVQKVFCCTHCGYISPKWEGKCSSCGKWNTLQEEIITKATTQIEKKQEWKRATRKGREKARPKSLAEIRTGSTQRRPTSDEEFNRVLGGGIVSGSIVLIGGEPGIGKSTLMLQLALSLDKMKVLYVSGEESEEQIKMRTTRLPSAASDCYIFAETNLANVLVHPDICIPDSFLFAPSHCPQLLYADSTCGLQCISLTSSLVF